MEKLDTIKQTIIDILDVMGFEANVVLDQSDADNIVINIETEEAGYLIGQGGANLQALQHLARLIVMRRLISSKQITDQMSVHFAIDINNYRKHRTDLLKEMAINMAQQALKEKQYLFLQPMPAYERRIIHMVLSQNPDVVTESAGEGEERRVIIKPKQ